MQAQDSNPSKFINPGIHGLRFSSYLRVRGLARDIQFLALGELKRESKIRFDRVQQFCDRNHISVTQSAFRNWWEGRNPPSHERTVLINRHLNNLADRWAENCYLDPTKPALTLLTIDTLWSNNSYIESLRLIFSLRNFFIERLQKEDHAAFDIINTRLHEVQNPYILTKSVIFLIYYYKVTTKEYCAKEISEILFSSSLLVSNIQRIAEPNKPSPSRCINSAIKNFFLNPGPIDSNTLELAKSIENELMDYNLTVDSEEIVEAMTILKKTYFTILLERFGLSHREIIPHFNSRLDLYQQA